MNMIIVTNRLIRVVGNLFKLFSYLFHAVLPKTRFTIPINSKHKLNWESTNAIPRVIWQTNYSNRSTLPVYLNYLFNRLMSLDYDYRYVSTEAREQFMRDHAPEHVYKAYQKLTDGAAQADLWRITVLYQQGGIYMDIDATLVWPLRKILQGEQEALYIKFKKGNTDYTNFFLATVPNNPHYQTIMNTIVNNIENYNVEKGVYGTTGPEVLNRVLQGKNVHARGRNYVCIQGTFTNEHFQYLDKPRGKWTHQDPNDLVKK